MEIKNVDNFTLQDCETFLQNNPDSELTGAVRVRKEKLLNESVQSFKDKMKWIDVVQFSKRKKYKTHYVSQGILISIICLCLFLFISITYYCNTEHYMYEEYSDDQATHVKGLEYFLLTADLITTPYGNDSYTYCEYEPEVAPTIFFLSFLFCDSVTLLLFSYLRHSPLVKKIYMIQDVDTPLKVVQDKHGKMGLCKAGRFKIFKLLDFEYDDIWGIYENGYICKKNGKYGIYNTETKKMSVPVQYDDIYTIKEDSVDLIKDGQLHRFTHNGYRIFHQ